MALEEPDRGVPGDGVRPLGPRRVIRRMFAVPPVCTAFWTSLDWEKVMVNVEEPDVLTGSSGTWKWTGEYDDNDRKLYRRVSS